MKQVWTAFVAITTLCCTTPAQAHPGHGTSGSSHYLTEPEHIVALGVTGMLIACLSLGKYMVSIARRESSAE